MNIVYATSQYMPTEIAITLRGRFNVAELCRRGHSVTVLSSGEDRLGPAGEVIEGVMPDVDTHGVGLAKRLLAELRLGIAMTWKILRRRRRTDMVIITSPAFFMMLIIALVMRGFGQPYVVDVRDRYPDVLFSLGVLGRNSPHGRLLSWLERLVYRGARAVTTVTQPICDDIKRDYGVDVQLVMNGYDAQIFTPRRTTRKDGPVRIVIHGLFGRFFDEQRFFDIAKTCAENALPHEFHLIGYGEKLDIIEAAGLANVYCHGRMSQHAVAVALRDMDIGAVVARLDPTTAGSFPVKALEYIGCGLPSMIIANCAAGTAVAEHGMGAAFSPDDWPAAANWLMDCISDPKLRAQYAEAAIANRDQYSRQLQTRKFADLIEALDKPEFLISLTRRS